MRDARKYVPEHLQSEPRIAHRAVSLCFRCPLRPLPVSGIVNIKRKSNNHNVSYIMMEMRCN